MSFIKTIEKCYFPGRTQVVAAGTLRLFLDSAHTAESMTECLNWFHSVCPRYSPSPLAVFSRTAAFSTV